MAHHQVGHYYMRKGEKLNSAMSRTLEIVDAIRVRIHYQQYAHPWGAVNLFIDDRAEDRDHLNQYPEAYSEIVRMAFNIWSLAVKYELSGDEIIAAKIKEILMEMCTLEKCVLSEFFSELELC